ncbi:MAG: TonB-dependent receptor, partial [Bacteroidota bacterium]
MKKSTLFPLIIIIFLLNISISNSQTAIIKGKISNSINNEAIPFASVLIQGTNTGVTSDIDGKYELKNLNPGVYNIMVSMIGFEKKSEMEVMVTNSKPTVINFQLKETYQQLKEVEVKTSPFIKKEESPLSLRSIGVTEISRDPGGNRDISKVIQTLPGVTPSVSFRNDILIRGGGPNENRFFIDGIEVPNINHFATQGASGGPVGMINVDFIRQVDFYSSAFPANRSNALSSIMEFSLKEGRSDRWGGNFTLGSSDLGITVEGPVNKNATLIASYRRSYLQYLFSLIGLPFLPTYNDFFLKYKWKIDNKNEITLLGLGAIDNFKLNTSLQANGTELQKYILGYLPVLTQWNYMTGVKYVHYNKKSFTTIALSRNMLNNDQSKYINNDESKAENLILNYTSQEIENKLRIERTNHFSDFKLNYGVNFELDKYINKTYNIIALPTIRDTINYDTKMSFYKWGFFTQLSKSFFDNRLGLSFGIRSDANNYSSAMSNLIDQLSPRFSLSYYISPKLSFNANTGIYYQLPPYTVLGFGDASGVLVNKANGIKYQKAFHIVAGFEYITTNNLKISLEGFLKYLDQFPFILKDSISLANLGTNYGSVGNEAVVSTSKGRAYGIEFLAQQKLFKGFYGLITYTFVRSEFKDKNDQYVSSSWDNKHIVNFVLGKAFKHNWEFGLKWRYSMGSPYTPYNYDASLLKTNWNINPQGLPDYSLLNSKRLKENHGLDIRVDKKYFFKKWSLNVYFDMQNVYNYKSELPPILNVMNDQNGIP